ncbi:MAG: patatin-like phospholipase family protein, partial [Variovorax sp.]
FASYLLFESGFTRELMELGRADTLAQRDAVCAFFGWEATLKPRAPAS